MFLSYSSSNLNEAEALANELKCHGVSVWFDRWEIHPGDSWIDSIEKYLTQVKYLLILIGNDYKSLFENAYMRSFFRKCTRNKVTIVPIILKSFNSNLILPVFLRDLMYVDLRSEKNFFEDLLKKLNLEEL